MTDRNTGSGRHIDASARVTLHFALRLSDGSEIDSNFAAEPAVFSMGDGSLLPGFERQLLGCRSGERKTVSLCADDAFGSYNTENVQSFRRSEIERSVSEAELSLEPGVVLSFTDKARGELPGVVQSIEADSVQVDFNHPLAGRDIEFEFLIVEVSDA